MGLRELVDDILEISVIGSFARLGYQLRRRLHGWADPAPRAMDGKTALVTGPTSGLGRAATEAMAELGARVILVGRDHERLARVRNELVAAHGEDRFPLVLADMSSLSSVRAAVELIRRDEPRLDVLIDNAGAIATERWITADGLESTLATMVAGPFTLISGLLPMLESSGDGRVISVVSGGMYLQSLPLDDLQYERSTFDGTRAYARAKRAATALIREWARRHGGSVHFSAMHPGWADTPGLAKSLPGFHRRLRPWLRSAREGVDTVVWLATETRAPRPDGRLWLDRRPRPFDRLPATRLDRAERRRLWDEVVRLTGVPDPAV